MPSTSISILFTAILFFQLPLHGQLTTNREGKLDRSFGNSGLAMILGQAAPNGDYEVISSPAGEVFHGFRDPVRRAILIVKQLPNGNVDPQFGQLGTRVIEFTNPQITDVSVTSLALQSDGRLLVGGWTAEPSPARLNGYLLRLLSNGETDTSFGSKGILTFDLAPAASPDVLADDLLAKVLVAKSGKIVVSLFSARFDGSEVGAHYLVLMQRNADGSPDLSFGDNGKVEQLIGTVGSVFIFLYRSADAAILADGKILVGVTTYVQYPSGIRALVLRYLPDGSIDSSFSGAGILQISRFSNAKFGTVRQLANGKLLIRFSEGMIRLNADGTVDPSFGFEGRIDWLGGTETSSLFITSNGKFILSDYEYVIATGRYISRFRKFWPDGSRDLRFGQSGMLDLEMNDAFFVKIIGIQGDRFVVGCVVNNTSPCSGRTFAVR